MAAWIAALLVAPAAGALCGKYPCATGFDSDCNCLGYDAGADDQPATHCATGFWGDYCEHDCPVQCAVKMCTRNGNCQNYDAINDDAPATHCLVGHWGDYCEHDCPGTCAASGCAVNGNCVRYDKLVDDGPAVHCKAGHWGDYCEHACPKECASTVCAVNGDCVGYDQCKDDQPAMHCQTGYWGDYCEHTCPTTCASLPCAVNGNCVGYDQRDDDQPATHCKLAYWGDYCEHSCPTTCASLPCAVNGNCVGYDHGDDSSPASHCQTGHWGDYCEHVCPGACAGGCLKNGDCTKVPTRLAVDTPAATTPELAAPTCSGLFPVTRECTNPDGTSSCSFYSACLEKAHPCGPSGYVRQFAEPMCNAFLKMAGDPSVSATTKAWMAGVRACLQTVAVPFVYNPKLTCAALQTAAFDSHPGCYTAPGNDICDHPSIWPVLLDTIGKRFWNQGVMGNSFDVALACGEHYGSAIGTGIAGAARVLTRHVVTFSKAAAANVQRASIAVIHALRSWLVARWSPPSSLRAPAARLGGAGFAAGARLALEAFAELAGNLTRAAMQSNETALAKLTAAGAAVFSNASRWQVDPSAATVTLRGSPAQWALLLDAFAASCDLDYTFCGGNSTVLLAKATEAFAAVPSISRERSAGDDDESFTMLI